MVARRYPLIAREAWPLLVVVAGVTLVLGFNGASAVGLSGWFLLAALIFLFRDPLREIPSSPLAVVSPVDGSI